MCCRDGNVGARCVMGQGENLEVALLSDWGFGVEGWRGSG